MGARCQFAHRTYCHAFKRCCRNAVSALSLLLPASAPHGPGVPLTWRPPALRLLGLGVRRVLAGYRIRVLDLLCLRHGSCFRTSPRGWWCGRSTNVARQCKLRNAAEERLSLAKPLPDLVTSRATSPWILHVPAHSVRAPVFAMQGPDMTRNTHTRR
jgi:hypothetical protein